MIRQYTSQNVYEAFLERMRFIFHPSYSIGFGLAIQHKQELKI